MRSLRLEAGGGRRLDPLLRQIMASAVERTRDQRERDTLEPPSTRQELRLDISASKRCIRRFVITEKAPTRAFSWLKAATKTLC